MIFVLNSIMTKKKPAQPRPSAPPADGRGPMAPADPFKNILKEMFGDAIPKPPASEPVPQKTQAPEPKQTLATSAPTHSADTRSSTSQMRTESTEPFFHAAKAPPKKVPKPFLTDEIYGNSSSPQADALRASPVPRPHSDGVGMAKHKHSNATIFSGPFGFKHNDLARAFVLKEILSSPIVLKDEIR